jgi:hypothetical protein
VVSGDSTEKTALSADFTDSTDFSGQNQGAQPIHDYLRNLRHLRIAVFFQETHLL